MISRPKSSSLVRQLRTSPLVVARQLKYENTSKTRFTGLSSSVTKPSSVQEVLSPSISGYFIDTRRRLNPTYKCVLCLSCISSKCSRSPACSLRRESSPTNGIAFHLWAAAATLSGSQPVHAYPRTTHTIIKLVVTLGLWGFACCLTKKSAFIKTFSWIEISINKIGTYIF